MKEHLILLSYHWIVHANLLLITSIVHFSKKAVLQDLKIYGLRFTVVMIGIQLFIIIGL